MIGFFIIFYGDDIQLLFKKVYSTYREKYIGRYIENNNYGKDLELILIEYNVRGNKFRPEGGKQWKVGNYRPKEKSIGVTVPVLKEFADFSEKQKKQFFVDTTMKAVLGVKERLEKKKMDIHFDKLISDLEECNEKYLAGK